MFKGSSTQHSKFNFTTQDDYDDLQNLLTNVNVSKEPKRKKTSESLIKTHVRSNSTNSANIHYNDLRNDNGSRGSEEKEWSKFKKQTLERNASG